jgi:hypothetical protein
VDLAPESVRCRIRDHSIGWSTDLPPTLLACIPSIMNRVESRLAVALLVVLPFAAGCDRELPPPPVITIIAPSDPGPLVPPVEVSGTVTGEFDIVQLSYDVDGGAEQEIAIAPGREVSFSFVLEDLPVGPTQITVHARDSRGSEARSVLELEGAGGPQLTILEPADGQIIRHPGTWVRVRVEHPGGTLRPQYSIDGGPWTEAEPFEAGPLTAPVDTVIGFSVLFEGSGARALTVRIGDGRNFTDATVDVQADVQQREHSVTFFGAGSRALGLNEGGTVVGHVPVDGQLRAFSWSNGQTTLLATPEGAASSAVAVNAQGVVAGWIDTGSCTTAVVWEGGIARTLTPTGTCHERSADINDTGYVAVNRSADPPYLVNLATDARTVFPMCGGTLEWEVVGLNDHNRVVGFRSGLYRGSCAGGFPSGFAWPMVDVGIFGRVAYFSGINDHGVAVLNIGLHGEKIVLTGEVEEALYLSAYGLRHPARAISDAGHVLAGGAAHLHLWTPDRTYRLETGPWSVIDPTAASGTRLNSAGQFVTRVENTETGQIGGALVTPVP